MATVVTTTPPAGEPVALAEARAVCRVDQSLEDGLISTLITAARQRIETELGLCLLATGITEWRDAWAPTGPRGGLTLARGPLIGVTTVAIADSGRNFRTLDPAYYAPMAGSWPPQIAATALAILQPTARSAGLRIDYVAGFGTTAAAVPAPLKQAILALVAWSYDHREAPDPPLSAAGPWLDAWRRARL
jgi:uncharacterized phiE125 gp8 family phage protein